MMEKMIRGRVPASMQTFMIDMTPEKEELRDWEEGEPDPVTGPFQTASEALLSPAGTDMVASRLCGLCLSKSCCYTCPRCNVPYCGLSCYRGPAHSACSEEFYKEFVSEELKCSDVTGDEGRAQMQEILLRLKSSAAVSGGLENVLKCEKEESREDVTEKDFEALELLTRLAKLQASGKEEKEVQEILQKLKNMEEGPHSEEEEEEEEEKDETLACKLSGVNINSLTEEELWDLLPSQDKEQFERLVMAGGIAGLVPLWRPWWERHEQTTKSFVEELQSEKDEAQLSDQKGGQGFTGQNANKETQMNNLQPVQTDQCPPQVRQGLKKQNVLSKKKGGPNSAPLISTKILPLHKLSSSHSPLVQFSMVNTLYGYAFSLCLFNGDISESEQMLDFCRTVLEISESLDTGRVFSSLSEALEGATIAVSASGCSDRSDLDAPVRALHAVAHILTGQSKDDPTGYSLSALTQLWMVFKEARASVSKEEKQWKRRFFLAGKKCEFFQSWVKENTEIVKSLARQAWREYNWKQTERKTLESERKVVEERWKKGRGKMLIEEI
ncbi:zinc finger HIT domain-containing protein 2 [Astyanax mexicanus]|uniref:Zinc finger HIT domain-containing protein 2 n=1 Tax=Astyanax mexicanus TaxID=7994 RepID=A0A8B9HQK8_ASTMX|nr:zinc finger HIT domain-containing protein 2 [Astyanax mexicanus]